MPKRITKPEPPKIIEVKLPKKIRDRVDVSVGAGVTIGGADLKTPGGMGTLPSNLSNNSEITKDAAAANPATTASLSSATINFQADAKNLARLGEGFVDAGVQVGYRPGENASATSVVIRGDYRLPVTNTPYGGLSVFGGLRVGGTSVSGAQFNTATGQGNSFSGIAGQVAIEGGVEMLVQNRFPVRLGLAYQGASGNFGSGTSLEGSAFLVTLEGGMTVVENGKFAVKNRDSGLGWAVQDSEAGLPPALTEFDKLERFTLKPTTLAEYNQRLTALAKQVGANTNLSVEETANAMTHLERLWLRTKDSQNFISDIGTHLFTGAVRDQRLLTQLADMYDKALKGAESLSAQDNCQAKLNVLTTFYAPIFGKNVPKDIQAQMRGRADKLMKDLVSAAEAGEDKTPGLTTGVMSGLAKSIKGTTLTIPKKTS